MLQKPVKSLLLQAKRFSALSNCNRHIIVAPKVKGTDFSVPCFYVYFIKKCNSPISRDNTLYNTQNRGDCCCSHLRNRLIYK